MKAIFSTFVILCFAATSALANAPPRSAGTKPNICSPDAEGVYRSVTTPREQGPMPSVTDRELPPVAIGTLTVSEDGTISGNLFDPTPKRIVDDSFTGKMTLTDSSRCLWQATVVFTDGTRNDLALVGSRTMGFSGANLVTLPTGEQFTTFSRLDSLSFSRE